MFALAGRTGGIDKIFNWKLEASKDSIMWVELYSANNKYISGTVQFFAPTISPLASYYKLIILNSEGVNLGLSYFQVFTYDNIELPYLAEIATDLR